jgi:hypothetical protein
VNKHFKRAIFSQPWGGLGDNLAFSNLPRLYNEQGFKFYVSFLNYSRNNEISNIVWNNNPYVENFKLLLPNIGYQKVHESGYVPLSDDFNVVQNINKIHGFEPGDGYSELYLSEIDKKLTKKKRSLLVDFNAFSTFDQGIYQVNFMENIINEYNAKDAEFLGFPQLYEKNILPECKTVVNIKGMEMLISMLINTDTFVCLNSGSHSLAAALKNKYSYPKKIICYYPTKNKKAGDYIYNNVEYKDVGGIKNLDYEGNTKLNINKEMKKSIKIHKQLIYYKSLFGK